MNKEQAIVEPRRTIAVAGPGQVPDGAADASWTVTHPDLLHQVVHEAPVGYVQADREGRITLANRRWCEMLQYSEAQMLGLSLQDVTHPEDLPQTLAAVQRMAQGGPGLTIDKRYLRRDGSTLWATSSVTPLRGPDGQYQGLVAVVLDVSDRKAQEQQLQRLAHEMATADQRKSEFLAMLAHELRNPLAPLAQALQMLQMDPGHTETARRSCQIMERQLRHLVRLVDELLDIARIARGKIALRPSTVELREVVQIALDLSTPLVRQRGHELSVNLPQDAVYLHADTTRLAQVLANLLNNAAKYTPPGGRIRLDAWTRGHSLTLSVRDNGVGIAPADLPHIFDLFTQVGRSLDMAQGGLGIGLALSRQLVELHGGRISASSEGLGRGSVFTVELPTRPAPVQEAHPAPAALAPAPTPLCILVVDDNADGANTMADLLQMHGHQAQAAYDGHSALALAPALQPQVAFLDLSMPGMDGFELAGQLRRQFPAIQLVALTGWASEPDHQRSQAAGFHAHLNKPVELPALEATLQQLAGNSASASASARTAGPPAR